MELPFQKRCCLIGKKLGCLVHRFSHECCARPIRADSVGCDSTDSLCPLQSKTTFCISKMLPPRLRLRISWPFTGPKQGPRTPIASASFLSLQHHSSRGPNFSSINLARSMFSAVRFLDRGFRRVRRILSPIAFEGQQSFGVFGAHWMRHGYWPDIEPPIHGCESPPRIERLFIRLEVLFYLTALNVAAEFENRVETHGRGNGVNHRTVKAALTRRPRNILTLMTSPQS